jgi:beta-fructofuranosidase
VQYFVGDFDATTCKFTAHSRGLADYGTFYAPNTMQLPNGRRLVWGWLNGFPGGRGWNGCLSLPRQLSLAADGQLVQEPAPQLSKLRGRAVSWEGARLNASAQSVVLPATNALEIQADISLTSPQPLELEIKGPSADAKPVTIRYEGGELAVLDSKAPLPLSGPVRQLKLRVFIDHSVLEVFANGTVCLTRVIPTLEAGATLSVRAAGQAQVKRLRVWPMNSIW